MAAEILEIDARRVRFRDEDGRTFSFPHGHPQLRHLDHVSCSTVHGAQARTARGVIAVLDAYGAADQALFHVEVSRAAEAFLMLTDDREALVEMLEARPGREEGALEALGLDSAEPPAVDPELFEALAADWRALQRQGEEAGALPFHLPGYEEVMARAAALSLVEDLSADMRVFVDGMLAEHERHIARERGVHSLAGRIRDCWRRWPELGWLAADRSSAPEDLPEYPAWRQEGTALLEEARGLELAPGPQSASDPLPAPDLAGGLEGEVAALERVRLRDDAKRFGRVWQALQERAVRARMPEVHAEGCAEVAELAARPGQAGGLDPAARRMVAARRALHDRQSARTEAIRSLPGRVESIAQSGGSPPGRRRGLPVHRCSRKPGSTSGNRGITAGVRRAVWQRRPERARRQRLPDPSGGNPASMPGRGTLSAGSVAAPALPQRKQALAGP